ncbi:MAG TPA: DUF4189 domain-containing protein [Candidatus Aquilonibacter sp.]|nr:DUF4189 domain-containing protein [Candidatus Aquilonibacter sp.]
MNKATLVTAMSFAALLAASSLITSVPAQASSHGYGAIATEAGNDDAIGHATNYDSRREAERAAVAACNKYTSGKNDCRVRVWFHKKPCAAYGANSKNFDYAFGNTKAQAERNLHEKFPEGQLVDSICND